MRLGCPNKISKATIETSLVDLTKVLAALEEKVKEIEEENKTLKERVATLEMISMPLGSKSSFFLFLLLY